MPWIRDSLAELAAAVLEGNFVALGPGALVGSLDMVAGVAWMVVLMWNAFSVSCHMKGGRSIALFVVAVVIGEMITKALVLRYL